jgi:hypothetical protein
MAIRGRPPKPQGMKFSQLTVYFPPNLVAALTSHAEATGVRLQDLLRRYLEDGLHRDLRTQQTNTTPTLTEEGTPAGTDTEPSVTA